MDRLFFYPSEQLTDTMLLTMERNKEIALGYLSQGVLGTNTVVDGLACTPTTPASLAVNIGPGSIYQQEPVDSTSYGSLSADTVDQIVKQGIVLPITSLTLTPPGTAGQAINYLIEAELIVQDTTPVVASYFNSANPTVGLSGPGGSGSPQNTIRQCTVSLVAKAGVAATAGSQVTPSPDAGYVGLWVVTVANGATTLTSAQISQYSGAPFITVKLPQVPTWVQGGTYAWGTDTGSANIINVTMNPVPTTISAGFVMRFKKAVTSTAAITVIVNGASAVSAVNFDGSAFSGTVTLNANTLVELTFDGTSYRWTNSTTGTAVGSLTASSGEGVTVNGSAVVSLNYPGLSVETTQGNTDLWSFYSQADTHHRVISWAQLLAAIQANLTLPSYSLHEVIYSTPGTTNFTVPAGITRIKARIWAGGAGAGGSSGTSAAGSGGAAGGYSEGPFAVTPGQVLVIVVGGGGSGGAAGANGSSGGLSSVTISGGATLLSATGGGFGYGGVGAITFSVGNPGTGFGGVINITGMNTGIGFAVNVGVAGGFGGAAFGTSITGPNINSAGISGCFPGGGGSGGAGGNFSGGNGAGGQVVIEY